MGAQEFAPTDQNATSFEVNVSNLSLPLPLLLTGTIGQHERYLSRLATTTNGINQTPGLELTPTRSVFLRGLRQIDKISDDTKRFSSFDATAYEAAALGGMLRSVHACFRGETVGDSLTGRLFPRMLDSFKDMAAAQRIADRPLHAVGYARHQGVAIAHEGVNNAQFKEWSVQPKAHDWEELWGLSEDSSEEQIKTAHRNHGFSSITFDLAHSQTFDKPLELCQKLARYGLVSEVHLALNRQDMAAKYGETFARTTRQAKEAFMRSPEAAGRTLEGEMLTEIIRNWKIAGWVGAVVYEEMPSRLARPNDVHRQQKAIIENTHALIADVKVA